MLLDRSGRADAPTPGSLAQAVRGPELRQRYAKGPPPRLLLDCAGRTDAPTHGSLAQAVCGPLHASHCAVPTF